MKKRIAFILLFPMLCHAQYKDVIMSEYRNYFLSDSGKVSTYVNDHLLNFDLPEPIDNGSAGVHHACMIGRSGQVYQLLFPGLSFEKIDIDNAQSSSSFWTTYAVITATGIKVFDNSRTIVSLQLPAASTKFKKLSASYVLLALDEKGNVWQYDWQGKALTSTLSLTELSKLKPKKIPLPGKATDITSSRVMYNVAVVNGIPYAWCESFGAQYIGLASANPVPVNMKKKWGLTKKIVSVNAGDNTLHMLDEDGRLLGIGDDAIGEVGDGKVHPNLRTTGVWDMGVKLLVTKAIDVSRGRRFEKISKGNSYVWRTFAKEKNGQWNSWGLAKGGLLANGIFPPDVGEPGIQFINAPRRVTIPNVLKRVSNNYLKTENYPPAEPVLKLRE